MNTRIYGLTATTLASFVGSALFEGVGDEQVQQDSAAVLMRRYAETHLGLAEVQLEMRLNANRKSPGTFTPREISRSEMSVEDAKEQLGLAMMVPRGDALQMHLRHAQLEASVSDDAYQRAMKANAASPPPFSEMQIKELRLESEVAQLRLAIWANRGTNTLSLMDHLHWQIERVSE